MAIFERLGTNDNGRDNTFFVRSDRLEVPDGLYFVGREVTITYIQGLSRSSFTATFAGYEEGTNYPIFHFDEARYRGITQRGGSIIGVSTSQTANTSYNVDGDDFVTDGLLGIGVETPDYLESVTFSDFGLRRPSGATDELTSQNREVRVDSGVYTVGQRTTLSVLNSDGSVNSTIEAEFAGSDPDTGGLFFNPVDPDGDGPLEIYRDGRQILLPSEKATLYDVPLTDIVAETVGIGVPTPGITASFADYGLRDGTTDTYNSQGREIVIEKGAYQAGDSVRAWVVLVRDENGNVSHVEHAFEATVVGHEAGTGNLLLDPPSDALSGTRIVVAGDKAATYTVDDDGTNFVTDAPLDIGFAYFSDFGLRVPGQNTYNSQDRGIEVEHGAHNVGDTVQLRIIDRRQGQAREVDDTFEATFRGYDRETGGPIFEPPSDVRSGRFILGVSGDRESVYTVTEIVAEPRPVGIAMFDRVGSRGAGTEANFFVFDLPVKFAEGVYSVGDTFRVTIDDVTNDMIFDGFERGTGYPVFTVDGTTQYIALSEEVTTGNYTADDIVTEAYTTCFAPGTWIATPDGERPVETLKPGDKVLTADCGVETVKWVGVQKVPTMFGPPELACPVQIMAGALDDNVPHTDLVVTKDHGMIVDGVICHAGALINGTSIVEVPTRELAGELNAGPPGSVYGVATYYHVETENHVPLLANGAVAESFIDNVGRARFDNHSEFVALYGSNVPAMTEMGLPRAMSARQVPRRVTSLLDERAAMILESIAEAPVARSA